MMEYEKLAATIAEVLNIGPDEIRPEASFVNDFGADSLDLFQLVLQIEEEFGVEISAQEAEGILTVSDAVRLLKSR